MEKEEKDGDNLILFLRWLHIVLMAIMIGVVLIALAGLANVLYHILSWPDHPF